MILNSLFFMHFISVWCPAYSR